MGFRLYLCRKMAAPKINIPKKILLKLKESKDLEKEVHRKLYPEFIAILTIMISE